MRIKALLFILAFLPFPAFATQEYLPDIVASCHSDFDDVAYDFYVTKSAFAKAPKWTPSTSPNPPLSPQAAERIASAQLKTFVPDKVDHMAAEEISLKRLNSDWIYYVTYHYIPEGASSGPPRLFTIPVYLDGSTITPVTLKMNDR